MRVSHGPMIASPRPGKGWQGVPITKEWLEDCAVLRDGWAAMGANETQFRRVVRGLNVLFKGLQEKVGQHRIHQFVRSLEALIFPDIGRTKKQFVHRCQIFASPGTTTRVTFLKRPSICAATQNT